MSFVFLFSFSDNLLQGENLLNQLGGPLGLGQNMLPADAKFDLIAQHVITKLLALLAMPPITDGLLPQEMPKSGVYLFTEFGKHLYVGRSNDLRDNYRRHCLPGAWQRHASLAVQLARQRTVTSDTGDLNSRPVLSQALTKAIKAAKARVRAMEYRFVEEVDERRQILLAAYCAIMLEACYDDFGHK